MQDMPVGDVAKMLVAINEEEEFHPVIQGHHPGIVSAPLRENATIFLLYLPIYLPS